MNKEKDRETKIEVAQIAAQAKLMDNQLNLEKSMRDIDLKERQTGIKDMERQEKTRSNYAKEELIKEDQRQKATEKGIERQDKDKDRDLKKEDLRLKEKSINKPAPSSSKSK